MGQPPVPPALLGGARAASQGWQRAVEAIYWLNRQNEGLAPVVLTIVMVGSALAYAFW